MMIWQLFTSILIALMEKWIFGGLYVANAAF